MAIKNTKTSDKTNPQESSPPNLRDVFHEHSNSKHDQGNTDMNINDLFNDKDTEHHNSSNSNPFGGDKWMWNDLSGLSNRNPFGSLSQSSADIDKLIKVFTSVIETGNNPFLRASGIQFEFLPVDKNTDINLEVSSLVILITNSKVNDIAFYKTLILQNPVENDLSLPEYENINGHQYEKVILPSDYYTGDFRIIIYNQVLNKFKDSYNDIIPIDATVITNGVMKEFMSNNSQTAEDIAFELIKSIIDGANSIYNGAFGNPEIDLNTHNNNEETHSQDVRFSKDVEFDGLGIPYRKDIELVTSSSLIKKENGRPVNNGKRSVMPLTHATGYIDLLWAPDAVNNPFLRSQNVTMQFYAPELVLTSLKCYKDNTLIGLLFALLNVSFIRENNKWLYTFNPSNDYNDLKINDIGAIGYDIDILGNGEYSAIATTPDKFNLDMLKTLHDFYFIPGLSFALDVPDCGFDTWRYRDLLRVATGDRGAIEDLLSAATTLTGGRNSKFMEIYRDEQGGTGRPIFLSPYKPILGYYNAKNGEKRDLRDLDYLAVAKYAGENDELGYIKEFSDLLVSNTAKSKATNVLQSLMGNILGNITVTGYATRLRFEGAFIEALVKASTYTRYIVNGNHDYNIYQGSHRSIFGDAKSSLVSPNPSGIFNINSNQNYYRPQGGNNYFDR